MNPGTPRTALIVAGTAALLAPAAALGTGRPTGLPDLLLVRTVKVRLALSSLPLATTGTVLVAAALAFAAVLLGSRLMAAASPAVHPDRGRLARGTAGALAILLPAVALLGLGAAAVNHQGHYVERLGDLGGARVESTSTALVPLASDAVLDRAPAAAWRARFSQTDGGYLSATWTGPVSGVSLPVDVYVPRGYRPDDGRTYGVIELLHGYYGTPESMLTSFQSPRAVEEAMAAGRIPPAIIVAPSLNVDGAAHDCADLAGRPAVGTWATREVPRMIRATFPNTTADPHGWLVAGVSAGAYCAAWSALEVPGQFGAGGALSSYNRPVEGGLATSGPRIAQETTLTTMLAARRPTGARLYIMGAQDDPYHADLTAWAAQSAALGPDSVTADTPATGGHAWPLWNERLGTMLTWWGADDAVWHAEGLEIPSTAGAGATGTAPVVSTPPGERTASRESALHRAVRPTGPVAVGAMTAAALLGCALALRWGPRTVPRPGARPAARAALPMARTAVVLLAAGPLAVAAGLAANAAGGYYTTWHDVLTGF